MYPTDPVTGQPIDPMTGQPMNAITGQPIAGTMPMNQPAGQMNAFLSSPGFAMANQAANNMMAMRRGQAPTASPADAYSRAVAMNANLRMRQQAQNQLEEQRQHQRMISTNADERAQARAERDADPMYGFNQFVEQRGIQDMPYDEQLKMWQDFNRSGMQSRMSASERKFALLKEMEASVAAGDGRYTKDDVSLMREEISKSSFLDLRDVVVDPLTGRTYQKGLSPQEQPAYLRLAEMEEKQATQDIEFRTLVDGGGIDDLNRSRNVLVDLRDRIMNDPEYQKTGPIEGPLRRFFGDEESAVMFMNQVQHALNKLAEQNLAPVSNYEVGLMMRTGANLTNQPEQNIAVLDQLIRTLDSTMDGLDRRGQYFSENNTLQGYGMSRYKQQEQPAPTPQPEMSFDDVMKTYGTQDQE